MRIVVFCGEDTLVRMPASEASLASEVLFRPEHFRAKVRSIMQDPEAANHRALHTQAAAAGLSNHEYKSQFGEDRLLVEYFKGKSRGFYVEVGANDGVTLSNTYLFEGLGWDGLLIEADPLQADKCRSLRPRAQVINCAAVAPDSPSVVTFEVAASFPVLSSLKLENQALENLQEWYGCQDIRRITVQARTLDSVLTECRVSHIDFVTIDVEGFEYDVLRGFNLRQWKPEVLILERNTILPDPRIMHDLHRSGYEFWRTTSINDWFRPGSVSLAYRARLMVFYYLPKYMKAARHWLGRLRRRLVCRLDRLPR